MKSALGILAPRIEAINSHKAQREAAAKRNRELMPETAAIVDEYRRVFGNGIKLKWAVENDRTVGNVPYDLMKDGI